MKMRRLAPMGAIYCPAYSLALTSVILFLSSVCSAHYVRRGRIKQLAVEEDVLAGIDVVPASDHAARLRPIASPTGAASSSSYSSSSPSSSSSSASAFDDFSASSTGRAAMATSSASSFAVSSSTGSTGPGGDDASPLPSSSDVAAAVGRTPEAMVVSIEESDTLEDGNALATLGRQVTELIHSGASFAQVRATLSSLRRQIAVDANNAANYEHMDSMLCQDSENVVSTQLAAAQTNSAVAIAALREGQRNMKFASNAVAQFGRTVLAKQNALANAHEQEKILEGLDIQQETDAKRFSSTEHDTRGILDDVDAMVSYGLRNHIAEEDKTSDKVDSASTRSLLEIGGKTIGFDNVSTTMPAATPRTATSSGRETLEDISKMVTSLGEGLAQQDLDTTPLSSDFEAAGSPLTELRSQAQADLDPATLSDDYSRLLHARIAASLQLAAAEQEMSDARRLLAFAKDSAHTVRIECKMKQEHYHKTREDRHQASALIAEVMQLVAAAEAGGKSWPNDMSAIHALVRKGTDTNTGSNNDSDSNKNGAKGDRTPTTTEKPSVQAGYQCVHYVTAGESTASIAEMFRINEAELRRTNPEAMSHLDRRGNFYPTVGTRLILPARHVVDSTKHLCNIEVARATTSGDYGAKPKSEHWSSYAIHPNVPVWCVGDRHTPSPILSAPTCGVHGMCDITTGVCACNPGFEGPLCTDLACPKGCRLHGRGRCDGETGTCKCSLGWRGAACDIPLPKSHPSRIPLRSELDSLEDVLSDHDLMRKVNAEGTRGKTVRNIVKFLNGVGRSSAESMKALGLSEASEEDAEAESIRKAITAAKNDPELQAAFRNHIKDILSMLHKSAGDSVAAADSASLKAARSHLLDARNARDALNAVHEDAKHISSNSTRKTLSQAAQSAKDVIASTMASVGKAEQLYEDKKCGNCSGHGVCQGVLCECEDGWEGEVCANRLGPTLPPGDAAWAKAETLEDTFDKTVSQIYIGALAFLCYFNLMPTWKPTCDDIFVSL